MGRKLRELYLDAQHHQPTIEVAEGDSWLDIRFDVTGIDETEIDAVLTSLLRNDAFYTLKSGEILAFDSEEFFSYKCNFNEVAKKICIKKTMSFMCPKKPRPHDRKFIRRQRASTFFRFL